MSYKGYSCRSSRIMFALACGMMVVLFTATSSWAQLNVLLITLDDMNYNSTGVTGCSVPSITPNMDALATESLRFEHAHVNVAVCQPCRGVLMTGRYSHRNGCIGFGSYGYIDSDVPTLQEQLDAAGYYLGILGKTNHLVPYDKFCWDVLVHADNLGIPEDGGGRDPQLYYNYAKSFIQSAQSAGKPFFLMANSHDPHHPFETETIYTNAQVDIPGFLPDLTLVRTDLARYYTSTHRGDATVGKVLQALSDTGEANSTLVMCMSDHGMAFPFAKANAWFSSSNTPWMVRWPGVVTPGVDSNHMISGIDYMPTILEACGLSQVAGMDGTSFHSILTGGTQTGRDRVHTMFYITAATNEYPMRSIQSKKYGYIYNDTPRWDNGGVFTANLQTRGLTWDAMVAAGNANPGGYIDQRVDFYSYRIREELYDYEVDPDALNNLVSDPQYLQELWRYRLELQAKMNSTSDPLASIYTTYLNSLPQTIPAIVTQHPSDQNVSQGETATFTVVATGSNPLSYQWQKDQSDLSNGGHYAGCTTATLTVSSVDSGDAANYRCVVTNAYGSETSNEATLTVNAPAAPTITQQPSSLLAIAGSTASFSVTATGTPPLSYQWQKNQSDLANSGHYSGATTATLTVSNIDSNDEADYRCVVTNGYGSDTSDEANLTISSCTAVLQNGGFEGGFTGSGVGNYWTSYVESGATGTFSEGTSSPPEGSSYQVIQVNLPAGSPNKHAGVYQTITGCTIGMSYTIEGSYRTDTKWNSDIVSVLVDTNGGTNWDSAEQTVASKTGNSNGTDPVSDVFTTFSGDVTATGTSMTIFLDVEMDDVASGHIGAFDDLTVTCSTPPVITLQPVAQDVYAGSTAQFTVAATGDGTLSYRWQKNQVNLNNGGHYSGVTTTTLTISDADSGDVANYRCVVTNAAGSTNSDNVGLAIFVPGDYDKDDDVDLQDFGEFQACLDADGQGPPLSSCQDADLNDDNLVDAADLAIFLGCMSGEGIPGELTCAN